MHMDDIKKQRSTWGYTDYSSGRKYGSVREMCEAQGYNDIVEYLDACDKVEEITGKNPQRMMDELVQLRAERDKFKWQPIEEAPKNTSFDCWLYYKSVDHGDWKSPSYVVLGSYHHKDGDELEHCWFDESHGGGEMCMYMKCEIPKPPMQEELDDKQAFEEGVKQMHVDNPRAHRPEEGDLERVFHKALDTLPERDPRYQPSDPDMFLNTNTKQTEE